MESQNDLKRILDRDVYTSRNEKLGRIKRVFLDDETNQPTWITVHTGLFGKKENWIPMDQAQQTREGHIVVPYDKALIEGSPSIDEDTDQISRQEEAELYQYYKMQYQPRGTEQDTADTENYADDVTSATGEVRPGGEERRPGGVRLRKYLVKDTQTIEIPVWREEVEVVNDEDQEGRTETERDTETERGTTGSRRDDEMTTRGQHGGLRQQSGDQPAFREPVEGIPMEGTSLEEERRGDTSR